jgi:post-segregation antitoxin (ccd killing protein)
MTTQALATPSQTLDRSESAGYRADFSPGNIDPVAEISISLPDDLVQELRAAGHRNVSAFVAALVRNELDRQRLLAFVEELEEELGPTSEAEIAEYAKAFARTAAITRTMSEEAAETE